MTIDSLHVRDLTRADHDEALEVRTRSFGRLEDSMRDWWTSLQDSLIEQRRVLGVFDGDRLVGHAKTRSFEQFWGGRPVPMAGVAGVVVSPEYRGRGVASMMMRALAERAVELGDAVSSLYPATVAPYRRTGWEIAGAQTRITIDTNFLRGLGSLEVPVRPGTKDDVELVRNLLKDAYTTQNANGAKLLAVDEISDALTDDGSFSYFTDDGFVLYKWHGSNLFVTCIVAATKASACALWSLVGSGSSVAKTVHAHVSPDDPIHLLLPEEASHDVRHARWMSRVLDAPKAVSMRGFPEGLSGSAPLQVEDPLLPSQDGTWLLELDGGRGSLGRSEHGSGALRLGPNGLAALYAGTPVHVLRTAGLAVGGSPNGDGFLDTAFAGRPAYLLEYF